MEADVLNLALKGCAVPLHLLPALAHTLLPLLGPEEANFPAVFFIFVILDLSRDWQIQIQNHENESQLSRAIN